MSKTKSTAPKSNKPTAEKPAKASKPAKVEQPQLASPPAPEPVKFTADTLPTPPDGATHYRYGNRKVCMVQKATELSFLIGLTAGPVEWGKADAQGDNFVSLEQAAEAAAKAAKPKRQRVTALPNLREFIASKADGSRTASELADAYAKENPSVTVGDKIIRREVLRTVRTIRRDDPASKVSVIKMRSATGDGLDGASIRKAARKLFHALSVISSDAAISGWLSKHDPKALEQVRDALNAAQPVATPAAA